MSTFQGGTTSDKEVERFGEWFDLRLPASDSGEQLPLEEDVAHFLQGVVAFSHWHAAGEKLSAIKEGYELSARWSDLHELAQEYMQADWPRPRRATGWFLAAALDLTLQCLRRFRKFVAVNVIGVAVALVVVVAYAAGEIPLWARSWAWIAAVLTPAICWWCSAICFDVKLGPKNGPSYIGVRAALPFTTRLLQAVRDDVASTEWDSEEIAFRLRRLEDRGIYLPSYAFTLIRGKAAESPQCG